MFSTLIIVYGEEVMLELPAVSSSQAVKKDYSIFKEISSTDSKITELAGGQNFLALRKLFVDSGLSDEFNITLETSDENTLRNIIIEMFKHTEELETAGVTKTEISYVKTHIYSALDSIAYIDDEVLLAGNDYLLGKQE